MDNTLIKHSKAHRLASLIEQDVRQRGLRTGDPYLTACEAGDNFRVDQFTATRALSLLAEKGVLIRKRGVGTFVGKMKEDTTVPALRSLSILKGFSKDDPQWSFPMGDVVQGLHEVMPDYQVQSKILPRKNPEDMARIILRAGATDGSLAGILLISCPREVQEFVLENRFPAISLGCVYPNTSALPSIDQDQFEVGRLQAKYLLERGHRRIMVFMRDTWRPGDNHMLEGINHAIAAAGLGIGPLIIRSVPEEESIIRKEIHRLLYIDDRPTGLICRCWKYAETAVEVLKSKSMRVPEDLDIVFSSHHVNQPLKLNLPRTCPKLSRREIAALVAKSLETIIHGKPLENQHVNLPIELVGPE